LIVLTGIVTCAFANLASPLNNLPLPANISLTGAIDYCGGACSADTTCCLLSAGWGCCPTPNGVCCYDKAFCCKKGETCSETGCIPAVLPPKSCPGLGATGAAKNCKQTDTCCLQKLSTAAQDVRDAICCPFTNGVCCDVVVPLEVTNTGGLGGCCPAGSSCPPPADPKIGLAMSGGCLYDACATLGVPCDADWTCCGAAAGPPPTHACCPKGTTCVATGGCKPVTLGVDSFIGMIRAGEH